MTMPFFLSQFRSDVHCLYCGANPVSHASSRLGDRVSSALGTLNPYVLDTALGRACDRLLTRAAPALLAFLGALGIARANRAREAIRIPRARVLWEEAERRGITMESIRIFGRETDLYRAEVGGTRIVFGGLPQIGGGSAWQWVDDKAVLKRKLAAIGVPVPRGGCVGSLREARAQFAALKKPVVVKPRGGSRGRHTTTFVATEADLESAYRVARAISRWVIVEEHLVGSVYRGTMVGGKLAGVLAGDPPRVTGDGARTIRELILQANARPPRGVKEIAITPLTEEFLSRIGHALSDILPSGETIDLSEKIGVSYGGSSAEVTAETHPEIVGTLERAARIIDHPVIGFDFIVPDISAPPGETGWGIIECNGLPFINLHYDPVRGATNNVAARVWDYVTEVIHRGKR